VKIQTRGNRLILILLAILLVVIAVEWYALRAARRAFSELKFRSGLSAAEVMIEACRTVYGFQVLREFERESRLVSALAFVPDTIRTGRDVERIERSAQVPLVVFTDFEGNIVHRSASGGEFYSWLVDIRANLPDIYDNFAQTQLFGIDLELPLEGGPKGIAVRVENGVVILFAPEPTLHEREELTVGRMIGRLGENPEVRYLALQDETGFIFATKSVQRMSSLSADDFLLDVHETGAPNYRYAEFSGERVFEMALSFPQMGRYRGVLRIGLSTADYDRLFRGYVLQIGVILLLVIFAVVGALMVSYRARRLSAQVRLSDAVVSEMNAACVAVNSSGNISLLNPMSAMLFGISQKEAIGRSYSSVFPSDELGLERVIATGQGMSARIEVETKKGARILDVSAGKLSDGGAFAVAEDVTDIIELKREAASLEHLRALGELAAGVAHEIRNPLNAIGIVAQRLSGEFRPTEGEEEYSDMLKNLRAEISRLDNIVREFIGLSAPMAPELSFAPLEPLIREIERAGRLRAEGSGIEFESQIEFEGKAEFDENQLKKALFNLLKNAVEATPSGGKIVFSVREQNGEIHISVWDSGAPVPDKIMKKLGKPFVSAGKEGGTGIGLFVAFRIAKDHRGRIDVETTEEGTSFTLVLPEIKSSRGRNES